MEADRPLYLYKKYANNKSVYNVLLTYINQFKGDNMK